MHTISRRSALKLASAGAAVGLACASGLPAAAQTGRVLNINLLGYSLGIHVPAIAGVTQILQTFPGYAAPKTQRYSAIETLTETLINGAADFGESDCISALRAIEAGANLKIIGNVYVWTDLVWLVNASKVQTYSDLFKPGVTIAANGRGDGTFLLLAGVLLKQHMDPDKLSVVEIGGSGARFAALLSGRVDGAPVHIDQVAAAQKQGNFKVLFEPWKVYKGWSEEVWITPGDFLKKPEGQRAAVDLVKANIMGFRKANADFNWYVDEYHKIVTLPGAATESPDSIRPKWQELSQVIKTWPNDGGFTLQYFQNVVPIFIAGKAIKGTVKLDQVVDPTYAQQALKELGKA